MSEPPSVPFFPTPPGSMNVNEYFDRERVALLMVKGENNPVVIMVLFQGDLEEIDEERKGRVELWLMDKGGWRMELCTG